MKIILLEYNDIHAKAVTAWIRECLPALGIVICQTEHSFRDWLEHQTEAPDLAILDPMAPWANPALVMPEIPSDVLEGGALLSGIRCAKLLRQSPVMAQIPIIFWTTLERKHWPNEIDLGTLVNKGERDPLLKAIRENLAL